mmetsp:Transcript_45113/g.119953  ORF Transcript_45113/g.119953 Transcript_45113/m.119953 type:complete len:126 (+) Transcript_45113:460-837(+)
MTVMDKAAARSVIDDPGCLEAQARKMPSRSVSEKLALYPHITRWDARRSVVRMPPPGSFVVRVAARAGSRDRLRGACAPADHVARLDVAVNRPQRVQIFEGRAYVDADLDHLDLGQWTTRGLDVQ